MAKKVQPEEGKVLYGPEDREETQTQNQGARKELSIDDIGVSSANFINPEIGEATELTIEKIEQVNDSHYHMSSVDYKIEITDQDGQILSITAHKAWGMVKQAIREAKKKLELESPKGLTLYFERPKHGEYKVMWYNPQKEEYISINQK